MTGQRRRTKRSPQREADDANASRRSWLMRPAVWVGTLSTAIISGVAITLASNYASHAVEKSSSPNTTGQPVKVLSESLARNVAFQGSTFIFRNPINFTVAQLGHINSLMAGNNIGRPGRYYSWARARGGVDPGSVIVQLVLAGNRDNVVRILNLRPVGQCADPLRGTLLYSPPAAQNLSVSIGLNLDQEDPVAQKLTGDSKFGQDYFSSKTVSLKYGEQQVFRIVAVTSKHYCQFRLNFTVLDGPRTIHETVGNGSQPFRVTALDMGDGTSVAAYKRVYVGGVADAGSCGGRFISVNPTNFSFAKIPTC
jgi:hypothetical protein